MLGRLREGAKAPQASQARASSPLRGAPFCAGFARVRASSRSGEVTSEAKSEGLFPFSVVHTVQFFSGIFGWLYSIFYKYEQNMSPPS